MKFICTFLFCVALSGLAYGNTITFDDLPAAGAGAVYTVIPNGYQGFNWNNFNVINPTGFPPTGFGTVMDSSPVVAYNGGAGSPSSFSSTSAFFLRSGYFASAYRDGMTLEVRGLNGTIMEFDETFTLNVDTSSFLSFPALPLTEVDFTTSGGGLVQGYVAGPSVMALDNLTFDFVTVPEVASTALLLAAGAGGLALLRKRVC